MSSAKLSLGLAARAGSAVVVVDTGGDARRIGAGGGFGGASDAGVGSGAAVPPMAPAPTKPCGAAPPPGPKRRGALPKAPPGAVAFVGVPTT